jgi:hypothetical protein
MPHHNRPPFADASNRPPLELDPEGGRGRQRATAAAARRQHRQKQDPRTRSRRRGKKQWPTANSAGARGARDAGAGGTVYTAESTGSTASHAAAADDGRPREIRAVREVHNARRTTVSSSSESQSENGRNCGSANAGGGAPGLAQGPKLHRNKQPAFSKRQQPSSSPSSSAAASTTFRVEDDRSSWMTNTPAISSRGAGTGLFAKQSSQSRLHRNKHKNANVANASASDSDRDELISLRVEVKSQAQVVQLLTDRVNSMTTVVERSRLAARAMETQLRDAQKESARLQRQRESTIGHEGSMQDQIALLEQELAAVKAQGEVMRDDMSRAIHERDVLHQQLDVLREQRANETTEEAQNLATLQDMQGLNAGLRRQLRDEQNRIVEAQAKVREAERETARLREVVSLRVVAVGAEREATLRAEAARADSEALTAKLKERMVKLVAKLNREADSRRTAVARAEATGSKAKKMESEVRAGDELVQEYDAKLSNLQGQVAMKDRRIQLMRKQHQGEIASHEATLNEKKALEKEVEAVQYDLDIANATISELRRGGPVMPGGVGGAGGGGGDIAGRDSLEDFKPFSIEEAMAMDIHARKPQKQRMRPGGKSAGPVAVTKPMPHTPKQPKPQKLSRRENLRMIQKMNMPIPDAAKLPGSNAPAWMADDGAEVM